MTHKEYPKLIMVKGKKVRVLNAEEEAKYTVDPVAKPAADPKKEPKAGWDK